MMAQATGPGATQPLEDKIVGARVVDIASTKNQPVRLILCARCQGQCVAGTRFCKYCGASLEERSSTPPRLASSPEGAPFEPVLAAPQAGVQAPASPDGSGGPRMDLADRMVGLSPATPDLLPRPAPTSPGHDAPVRPQASAPSPVPLPHPGLPPIRAPHKPPVSVPGREPPRAVAAQSDPAPRPSPEPKHDGGAAPAGRASAASASRGRRLVVIVEDGTEGRSYPLLEQQIDIGRYEGHIRLPDDPYVSPRHARLLDVDGRWILRDLDSTNRVYVRIRKPHPLRDADLLLLGLEVLQFHSVTDGERGLGHAKEHGTLVFGSPASPRRARLAQRTVEGITRDVYHLFRDETVIGREIGDIVFTADPFLSRRHAAIRRNPTTDEFSIIDLDSSNGSYIAIREDVTVHNGDFVRIGQHLFRVDLA
jgi:pSer/pThr/pTyr-binding forkhead associated (FHA) protein